MNGARCGLIHGVLARGPVFLFLAAVLVGGRSVAAQQALTRSPHGPLEEGLECDRCHTATTWTPLRDELRFDHERDASFALTGSHSEASCVSCHVRLRFDALDPEAPCSSCHMDVHQGSLSVQCDSCHDTGSFKELSADEVHSRTRFPLTGAHLQVTCESCHADDRGGAFSPIDDQCVACHGADYEDARQIDHVSTGFSTSCQECHTTLAWVDVPGFNHAEGSGGFLLAGAHRNLPCTSCHIAGSSGLLFAPTGQDDCVACHQADYDREHPGGSFPATCPGCHTVDAWTGAAFDHVASGNGFELVGAHTALPCGDCHIQPGYQLLFSPAGQDDCVACHQADFQREHGSTAGYPTTCIACHNTDVWTRLTFDHDAQYFPVFRDPHNPSKWNNDCSTCHTVPGDFGFFTCLVCHDHNQSKMDDTHKGEGDYAYESGACLSCHPDGRSP